MQTNTPAAHQQPTWRLRIRTLRDAIVQDINAGYEKSLNYAQTDLFVLRVFWGHFAVVILFAVLVAWIRIVDVVGPSAIAWKVLPQHVAIACSVIAFGINILAYVSYKFIAPAHHYCWRLIVATLLTLYSMIFVFMSAGTIEMHFHFFIIVAFLIIYADWRLALVVTVLTALHHVILDLFAPAWVFHYGRNDISVLVHALLLVTEVVFAMKLCNVIRRSVMSLEQERATLDTKVKERTNSLEDEKRNIATLNRRFDLATESAKIGIWEWDIPENKLIWDKRMYDLYGTKEESFSGAYEAWQKGLHPDDKKKGDEEIQWALKGVKDFDTDFRVVWSNGSIHIIRAIAEVVKNEKGEPVQMIGVNWDITKEKESEQDLLRYKAIVRDSTDAIIGKTTTGIVTSWNEGAQKLYGYSPEEIIGKSIRTIVPPDNDDVDQLLLKVLQGERIPNYETIRKHKDGHLIEVSITVSPVKSEQGVIVGVSVVARDISAKKRLERAQSEFVSLASHQLRTPLTAIKWIVSTLADGKMGPLQDPQKDVLNDAKVSVDRMNETITTMLMISRIETNNLPLVNEPLSIQNILGNLQIQMKNIYESKRQQVTIECPADVSLTTDRKILIEILTNLMSNAVKYTPDEGKVSWVVKADASTVTLAISDSGYGIPDKDKDRIFSRFFRAENVKSMQTEGTGLGLYLVASLVKVLGGTISFTSVEGKGTTFTCIFPLSPPAHGTDPHR